MVLKRCQVISGRFFSSFFSSSLSDDLGKVSNGLGKVSDGPGKVSDGVGKV